MKILYFHQHFSTPKGSTGIRSYQMAQRLISRGHEVTMVCGSYGGGETGLTGEFFKGRRTGVIEGIRIIEFDLAYSNSDGFLKRSLTFIKFALKSISIALSEKYDIVFATSTPLTAGVPGIFAKFFRRKRFIFEVRDLWPELPKAMRVITNPVVLGLMSLLEWVSYRSADKCIGLAPGITEGIIKKGVNSSSVATIPNGCDIDIFSNVKEKWRPDGVEETDLMAIFTGTHGIANGLDAVLDVAAELCHRKVKYVKFVLIGQGKLKAQLVQRAKDERLDNVIFLDPVSKSRLSELMAGADIGLQALANVEAFYNGTSPNKFFDYIASGLPVLINYPGWLAKLIEEYNAGYLVQPNSPKEYADLLVDISKNKDKLAKKGENGLRLARSKFNRPDLADQWVDFVTS